MIKNKIACVEIFCEGDDLYSSMLKHIEQSQHEILLETYIFNLDKIGERFINLLNKKAQQNISIKIHLDAVGSRYFHQAYSFKKRLDPKIQIKWFHRWSWRNPMRFNVRNHRKTLIIDKNIAFTGGFNIHQESSEILFGESRWRDTHVKLNSQVAKMFAQYFNDLWNDGYPRYLGNFDNLEEMEYDLLPNFGYNCNYLLRCRLTQLINQAQKNLLCTTPYFVPDEYLLKALINAAKRGVQVELLVPFESDHPMVNTLAKHYYNRLLQAGIKLYAYTPRFLHAKTIVVDSQFVLIGSANLDYRSLFINHELVLLLNNESLAGKMVKIFREDCESAISIKATSRFKDVKNWWLWRPLAALLKHWI